MLTVTRRHRSADDNPTYVRTRLEALFGPHPHPGRTDDGGPAEAGSAPTRPADPAPPGRGVAPPVKDVTTEEADLDAGTGATVQPGWFARAVSVDWRAARVDPGLRGALALLAVALAVAGVAGLLTWRARPTAEPVPVPPARYLAATSANPGPPSASASSSASASTIVVAVAGRVRRPGIVTLARGARVVDALQAAGGPVPGADLGLLNLARPLGDGEQVVVGVPAPDAAARTGPAGPGSGPGNPGAGGPVNVNAATADELVALPGIGPVTAQRIVDWRVEHGRFASVDQLRQVPGIGPAKLAQIRGRVTV